jgi:hypothetical protein
MPALECEPASDAASGSQELRLVAQAPLASGTLLEPSVSQSASFRGGGDHFPDRPLYAVSISKLPQGCSALNEDMPDSLLPVTLTPVDW